MNLASSATGYVPLAAPTTTMIRSAHDGAHDDGVISGAPMRLAIDGCRRLEMMVGDMVVVHLQLSVDEVALVSGSGNATSTMAAVNLQAAAPSARRRAVCIANADMLAQRY